MSRRDITIKDTHRGLWYEDGVLLRTLGAGRYTIPWRVSLFGFPHWPRIEVILVDMRERDLTIKGQEILTADKVAIRVSIIVQFRVTDPEAALHAVEDYESRLYSDVQLAARRSLATMSLEDILTNRNLLSETILNDVQEAASSYGVAILRADIKDLIFPGNLQEIMNRVLAAERMSQAQLVESRTQAEIQQIEAQADADARRLAVRAESEAAAIVARNEADLRQVKTDAELRDLQQREAIAEVYTQHPALLRLLELETLRDLAQNANAKLNINFNSSDLERANQDDG